LEGDRTVTHHDKQDIHVRVSSLLKDTNKIVKDMNNLADILSQTTGSEALIVVTNRLPGVRPALDLQGSRRAVAAVQNLKIMDTMHRWATEVVHQETREFYETRTGKSPKARKVGNIIQKIDFSMYPRRRHYRGSITGSLEFSSIS